MRLLIASFVAIAGIGWLSAHQQVTGTIEKNPGKPLLAVPDFRAGGAAAPLVAIFNTTVAADLQGSPLINVVPKTMYPLQPPQQPTDLVAGAFRRPAIMSRFKLRD